MFQSKSNIEIRDNKLFADVDFASLKIRVNNKDVKKYSEGDIIYTSGDNADALYLVISGEVKVKLLGNTNQATKIYKISKLDFFGEREILKNLPSRSSSAVAESPCTIYSIKSKVVAEFSAKSKNLLSNLYRTNDPDSVDLTTPSPSSEPVNPEFILKEDPNSVFKFDSTKTRERLAAQEDLSESFVNRGENLETLPSTEEPVVNKSAFDIRSSSDDHLADQKQILDDQIKQIEPEANPYDNDVNINVVDFKSKQKLDDLHPEVEIRKEQVLPNAAPEAPNPFKREQIPVKKGLAYQTTAKFNFSTPDTDKIKSSFDEIKKLDKLDEIVHDESLKNAIDFDKYDESTNIDDYFAKEQARLLKEKEERLREERKEQELKRKSEIPVAPPYVKPEEKVEDLDDIKIDRLEPIKFDFSQVADGSDEIEVSVNNDDFGEEKEILSETPEELKEREERRKSKEIIMESYGINPNDIVKPVTPTIDEEEVMKTSEILLDSDDMMVLPTDELKDIRPKQQILDEEELSARRHKTFDFSSSEFELDELEKVSPFDNAFIVPEQHPFEDSPVFPEEPEQEPQTSNGYDFANNQYDLRIDDEEFNTIQSDNVHQSISHEKDSFDFTEEDQNKDAAAEVDDTINSEEQIKIAPEENIQLPQLDQTDSTDYSKTFEEEALVGDTSPFTFETADFEQESVEPEVSEPEIIKSEFTEPEETLQSTQFEQSDLDDYSKTFEEEISAGNKSSFTFEPIDLEEESVEPEADESSIVKSEFVEPETLEPEPFTSLALEPEATETEEKEPEKFVSEFFEPVSEEQIIPEAEEPEHEVVEENHFETEAVLPEDIESEDRKISFDIDEIKNEIDEKPDYYLNKIKTPRVTSDELLVDQNTSDEHNRLLRDTISEEMFDFDNEKLENITPDANPLEDVHPVNKEVEKDIEGINLNTDALGNLQEDENPFDNMFPDSSKLDSDFEEEKRDYLKDIFEDKPIIEPTKNIIEQSIPVEEVSDKVDIPEVKEDDLAVEDVKTIAEPDAIIFDVDGMDVPELEDTSVPIDQIEEETTPVEEPKKNQLFDDYEFSQDFKPKAHFVEDLYDDSVKLTFSDDLEPEIIAGAKTSTTENTTSENEIENQGYTADEEEPKKSLIEDEPGLVDNDALFDIDEQLKKDQEEFDRKKFVDTFDKPNFEGLDNASTDENPIKHILNDVPEENPFDSEEEILTSFDDVKVEEEQKKSYIDFDDEPTHSELKPLAFSTNELLGIEPSDNKIEDEFNKPSKRLFAEDDMPAQNQEFLNTISANDIPVELNPFEEDELAANPYDDLIEYESQDNINSSIENLAEIKLPPEFFDEAAIGGDSENDADKEVDNRNLLQDDITHLSDLFDKDDELFFDFDSLEKKPAENTDDNSSKLFEDFIPSPDEEAAPLFEDDDFAFDKLEEFIVLPDEQTGISLESKKLFEDFDVNEPEAEPTNKLDASTDEEVESYKKLDVIEENESIEDLEKLEGTEEVKDIKAEGEPEEELVAHEDIGTEQELNESPVVTEDEVPDFSDFSFDTTDLSVEEPISELTSDEVLDSTPLEQPAQDQLSAETAGEESFEDELMSGVSNPEEILNEEPNLDDVLHDVSDEEVEPVQVNNFRDTIIDEPLLEEETNFIKEDNDLSKSIRYDIIENPEDIPLNLDEMDSDFSFDTEDNSIDGPVISSQLTEVPEEDLESEINQEPISNELEANLEAPEDVTNESDEMPKIEIENRQPDVWAPLNVNENIEPDFESVNLTIPAGLLDNQPAEDKAEQVNSDKELKTKLADTIPDEFEAADLDIKNKLADTIPDEIEEGDQIKVDNDLAAIDNALNNLSERPSSTLDNFNLVDHPLNDSIVEELPLAARTVVDYENDAFDTNKEDDLKIESNPFETSDTQLAAFDDYLVKNIDSSFDYLSSSIYSIKHRLKDDEKAAKLLDFFDGQTKVLHSNIELYLEYKKNALKLNAEVVNSTFFFDDLVIRLAGFYEANGKNIYKKIYDNENLFVDTDKITAAVLELIRFLFSLDTKLDNLFAAVIKINDSIVFDFRVKEYVLSADEIKELGRKSAGYKFAEKIVSMHDASVKITAEQDKGTSIKLIFPMPL